MEYGSHKMIKPLIESKDVFLLISILLQTIRPCLGLDLGWLVEDKMEDVSSFPKHHLFFFCVCPFLSYACVFTPLSFFSCTPLRLFTSMRPSLWCPIWATCPMPRSLSETFAWSPRLQKSERKDCWLSIYFTIGVTEILDFLLCSLEAGVFTGDVFCWRLPTVCSSPNTRSSHCQPPLFWIRAHSQKWRKVQQMFPPIPGHCQTLLAHLLQAEPRHQTYIPTYPTNPVYLTIPSYISCISLIPTKAKFSHTTYSIYWRNCKFWG